MPQTPSAPAGSAPPVPPDLWDPRVRAAMRLMEAGIPPPSLAAVAARVGMTPFQLVRAFRAQVGVSPAAHARTILLAHAASRLQHTDDALQEVAQDFGYATQAAFTKAFTRAHGASPSRWRQAARLRLEAREPGAARSVRMQRLRPQPLWARRYLGPRSLSGGHWADFLRRLPSRLRQAARTGLLYDDPRVTPAERIRYDCAVGVRADAELPPELAAQGFERIVAPGGEWACTDAVGLDGVGPAYRRILVDWLPTRPDRTLEGDPHLERFLVTPDLPERPPVLTVCLRVRRPADLPRPGFAEPA